MLRKITRGTVTIDGTLYKAFENCYTKQWYIVEGVTCFDKRMMTGIKATSGKQAIQKWLKLIHREEE